MRPLEIDVQAPSNFLRGLYDLDSGLFVGKVHEQAGAIGVSLPRLLNSLSKNVPGVVEYFCEERGIDGGYVRVAGSSPAVPTRLFRVSPSRRPGTLKLKSCAGPLPCFGCGIPDA